MKPRSLRASFLLAATLALPAISAPAEKAPASSAAERRVLDYLREHVSAGQPVVVSELYSKIFTRPEERQALDKLYNAFFRIPLFVAQYQEKLGAPPSLKIIAQQFDLESPEAADVLVRVMESDPRVPRFLTLDPQSREITRVDVEAIRNDARFGRAVARQLSGWEGQPAPAFTASGFDGGALSSAALRGKVVLLYVWFTGCPPCMKETPDLVALEREFSALGLAVVGANADRLLGLSYTDSDRARYAQEQKINFPLAPWSKENDAAFGNISIFPTLFLIGRKGVIVRHWVGYTAREELRGAIAPLVEAAAPGQ